MSDIPPETRRVQSLLTSLIIITILILGLVLVIAAYPTVIKPLLAPATPVLPVPRPSDTPLTPIPTFTPTETLLPRPSLTPSITPTPTQSLTPTLTPTPPGPPTLTPAQPAPSDPYRLIEWNEDLANLSIELMKDYPNTLIPRLRGDDNRGYYDAFTFAVLAAKENLQRFPDAPQAAKWRFDLAYNLAQLSDPQAGQVYAEILTEALNRGEADLDGLADWFKAWETRTRLNVIELAPPPGSLSSHILEVHGPGSAFIWLLETPAGYQTQVLESTFDFANPTDLRLIASDFTGDGLEDVAIYNTTPSSLSLELPRVYDLAAVPAKPISFRPSEATFEPGMEYTNNWRVAQNAQGGSGLQMELRLFPGCPVTARQTFLKTGLYLERIQSDFEVEPAPGALSLCRFVVENAANLWGPRAAIQIMQPLLEDWPPAQNEEGKPFPADAKDEWRYRLGVYHALLGEYEEAKTILNELVQKPTTPGSRWVEPANQFLALYQSPTDIYRACTQAQYCNPNQAIETLVNQLGVPEGQDPVEFLSQKGLLLRSSGYFDFDGDDVKERWFTVRHRPLEKLELWFLAATPQDQRAINVGPVEGDRPNLQFLEGDQEPPIVWVDEGLFITFGRDEDSAWPFIRRVSPSFEFPNRFRLGLQAARQALLDDQDPARALDLLTALEQSPGLACKSNWSCDEYYYLLGLAHELLGNTRPAVEAFLSLWRDYTRSPFTTLARLKLAATIIQPTPSSTSTLTAFPTSLLTPGTPTPLGTPAAIVTPTATATLSANFTPLVTTPPGYPGPGQTVTIEPTNPITYPTP